MIETGSPIKERSAREIEEKLSKAGEYVQMDYLRRALRSDLDFETKKYVLLKLARIYHSKRMFSEAGKMMKTAAEINTTFKSKIEDYMKSVELYIMGGDYIEADRVFGQAVALGNTQEKNEMKKRYKDQFLNLAKKQYSEDKRNNARKILEKTLTLELEIGERSEIQKMLLELYQKLGLMREYYKLKGNK